MKIKSMACVAVVLASLGLLGCGEEEPSPPPLPAVEGAEQAAVANTTCPIMGTEVDPSIETRTYKGVRIGFCCAGCPQSWDQLSEQQKDAKLAEMQAE